MERHVTMNVASVATSLSVTPAAVTGGASAQGTVTIDPPAPAGGTTVTLSSNNLAATVPGSVSLTEGEVSKDFTISTTSVGTQTLATITATAGGQAKAANLVVNPPVPVSLTFANSNPGPGQTTLGTVTIDGPAPSTYTVSLTSSDPVNASIPPSIMIAAGSLTGTFTVTTGNPFAATPVKILAARAGTTVTGSLTVSPLALSNLAVLPKILYSGDAATGTL